MRRSALAASLVALTALTGAVPARASVTIGQIPPTTSSCAASFDYAQPTVIAGNTYVVPSTGGITAWTVTSWSTQANANGGLLAMKMYRPLGGATYQVVGHEGPHLLMPSALNSFTASVPVKAGDVHGNSTPPAANLPACASNIISGETFQRRSGNLADGGSGDFMPFTSFRLNITAVLVPSNTFTLGAVRRNRKKGTATLTVDVPNPGELVLAGNGLRTADAGAVTAKTVTAAGNVALTVRAKGRKRRKLNQTGKVKVSPSITYTPATGDSATQSTKLKLRKKR